LRESDEDLVERSGGNEIDKALDRHERRVGRKASTWRLNERIGKSSRQAPQNHIVDAGISVAGVAESDFQLGFAGRDQLNDVHCHVREESVLIGEEIDGGGIRHRNSPAGKTEAVINVGGRQENISVALAGDICEADGLELNLVGCCCGESWSSQDDF